MWFSGKNYMVSYDGIQMDTISISNDKGEVHITGMLETRNADLVVSTTKGLYLIDPGSSGAGSCEQILDGCINAMVAQDNDHVWLGTNQGLLFFSFSHGLIKKLTMDNGLPSDAVHGLLFDSDSTLWITTWHGMAILPADEAIPATIEHENHNLYGQMAEDSEGHIWAGGESEITILDKERRKIRSIPSEINSRPLPPTFIPWQILLCDSRGLIWHAVPDHVIIHDPKQGIQRYCNLNFNLRIEQPSVLFEDKDGSIWLATSLGNIYRYDVDLFSYLTLPISSCPFPLTSIQAVAPLQTYCLTVATTEGLYLTTKEFSTYQLILSESITALHIDPENRIWVTTDDELVGFKVDKRSLKANVIIRKPLPDISVSGLLVDGSDCWISTYERGVRRLNLESGETSSFIYHPGDHFSLSSNHITSMERYGGKIWIGSTEGKINMIDPMTNEIEAFNVYPGSNSSLPGMINHMIQVNGELWIATNTGISKIKDRDIESADLFDQLDVKQILKDSSGLLWISHMSGLNVYDRHNDRSYHLAGRTGKTDVSYLFLGPDQDVYLKNDTEIRQYSHILPGFSGFSTIISQSKINNIPYPLRSGSELAHDENNLEIMLSVLSFRNTELNRYSVFLEGWDTAWQESASPVFVYQNLKPGNYLLHFRGVNFTGQWGPETKIPFTILPSPWLTNWALAGYSLALMLMAILFFTLRKRNLVLARNLQDKTLELGRLKKHFQDEMINELTTDKIEGRSLPTEEIRFLRKVIDFIDTHLAEDGFSVENLAHGLSMSRTKLFRQMKLVTGLSPTDFSIKYRLNLAAEMIRKKTGNISEIAFSVGYKNPAHFSKSFRKFHGCTPSEFLKSSECNQKESL
jgi:ligand-binding sensor domain-containing protein/AraC-like DNA-binding protein